MTNINCIKNLRLSNFLQKETFEEKEFNYSGIDGIAEVLGWHVIFFRDLENQNYTSAISLNDANINEDLSDFANKLLIRLNINLKIGDNFEKIKSIYGEPISSDEILEGTIRYNYLLNTKKFFVSFGIDDIAGLKSIEIINNKKIINGIINENWR